MLQCRTNSTLSMFWVHGSSGGVIASTSRRVYPEYPRLSLNDTTDGQFDLLIHSTQREDAGTYTCFVGFNEFAEAELILLGKHFVLMFCVILCL